MLIAAHFQHLGRRIQYFEKLNRKILGIFNYFLPRSEFFFAVVLLKAEINQNGRKSRFSRWELVPRGF